MSQNQRLGTASADLEYDEYVHRRDKELQKTRPGSKKSLRSSSGAGRPSSKTSRPGSKNSKNADSPKPYELEGHEYRKSGYETFNTQLGEDPMTAIRTLKSRLRALHVSSSSQDRTVKAQLAKQACDKLAQAENEMANLSHVRSQAILTGNVEKAKQTGQQMQQLRDKATFETYTDLLLDDDEISPFGVKSKWAPDPEHPGLEDEPVKPKQKKEAEYKPIRSLSARKRDREKKETKDTKLEVRALTPNKPTKRNVRIFGGTVVDPLTGEVTAAPPGQSNPYGPADEYGECPYCDEKNVDFSRNVLLKRHMKEACPCITICDYCDKVIEVASLNEHHLQRCQFVGNSLAACGLCGLACYRGEQTHPRCRKMPPPEDSEWCPLCSIAVKPKDSKDAWSKHLKDNCYNNPRKNMSGVPDPDWSFYDTQNPPVPEPIASENKNNDPLPPDLQMQNATDPNNDPNNPQYDPNNPNNFGPAPPPIDGYPQYVYTTNNMTPEAIREAFDKIKKDRKLETERLRREEAAREKTEEEAAEKERVRIEKEVEKIKKKQAEEKKNKGK